MRGRVVLNTRPSDQAAELSRLLSAAGFTPIESPAIAIVSAWDAATLQQIRSEIGSFSWVLLASQNAAHAVRDTLQHARIVCGSSTARALGLSPEIELTRFSASAAIDALRDRITRGDRILVPGAAQGRDELVDGLRALGARVESPVAYRTIPVSDAADRLRAGGIDVVTLCSPSAVSSVRRALTDELLVCLGETTASAAHSQGLRVHAVAASTSMAALVDAVQSVLGARV